MLSVTLYFAVKGTLPWQISENSEADPGCMPGPGCNSCTCGNCWEVKTVNTLYQTRKKVLLSSYDKNT